MLAVLEFAERGQLPPTILPLSPELAFQFYTYWTVVAHRRRQRPDVRLPFHHLQSDGFWSVLDEHNQPSDQPRTSKFAVLPPDFVRFANDPASRERGRQIIIAKYFREEERVTLYSLLGLSVPSDDQIARDAAYEPADAAVERGREARFRLIVIPAYNYTCALTGYRLTTITSGGIVDAAHIHQFADSRNNDPTNGIALCKNAHWQFDRGLWTVSDQYQVMVAMSMFSEACPNGRPLAAYHGETLRLPPDRSLWPDLRHLSWHRKHRFQQEC
ncbi:MAG: HNH endonuclease [Planctomycetes bacterium]|nr:HNH endonuclease [Planctomycetota bacterium]